ncbi:MULTISPECIES: HAAS signaling domain-containing protein [unclassified Streptomyces]|uniref:HAAS signaling domain-containing protein n=1 Tax=unclassified Streptomyces TaxID=2593676 RepID=UPI002E1A8D77
MKTDDTLVKDYFAAVERETSTLPPAARQELIADLNEHIQVALAERPGSTREILNEIGDPRTIAATALQELGMGSDSKAQKPGRRRSPAWLPVVLLIVANVLPYAGGFSFLAIIALAAEIAAVVMVIRSSHWTSAQKRNGLIMTPIIPVVAHLVWYAAFVVPDGKIAGFDIIRWTLVALLFVLTLIGANYLWRNKRS